MDDADLRRLSREGQLYLSLVEMQTIQAHFRSSAATRPTSSWRPSPRPGASIAATRRSPAGSATGTAQTSGIRKHAPGDDLRGHGEDSPRPGPDDWCVSVFRDNAGVVRFDDEYNVVFKVETHNHPSAIEPYGGANTGIGGVIRDPMGTGLGAKPICNTDVFCFAPPDTPPKSCPPGVLHPRRVIKGVVAGVRDYGNRMGIPTVNGAVYLRSPLPRQSAGLLRHRRPDPPRQVVESSPRPAT